MGTEQYGNSVDSQDQGEVLDASHSQEATEATEENPPRAPENREAKEAPSKSQETKQKIDYEKSYKELEKTYQRQQQEYSRFKKEYEPLAQYKDNLPRWAEADKILTQDPVAFKYVQARLQGYSHEQAQNLSEQSQKNPALDAVYQKVSQFDAFMQKQQQAQVESQASSFLDQQESQANSIYKQYFGKDMTGAEKSEVYNWMTQNDVYNGTAAVNAVFAQKYAESYAQKILQDQKAKAGRGMTQTRTTNSSNAKQANKNMDFKEAFYSSLKELRGDE